LCITEWSREHQVLAEDDRRLGIGLC
jgi:hypothetical protein